MVKFNIKHTLQSADRYKQAVPIVTKCVIGKK